MPLDATADAGIVDHELDELLSGLPAIALEGPQAVGKTATALRRATTVYRLDNVGIRGKAANGVRNGVSKPSELSIPDSGLCPICD